MNELNVDKERFEEVLETVIKEGRFKLAEVRANGGYNSSNGYQLLINDGLFTKEAILKEMPLLFSKTSTLSSEKRKAMMSCINMAMNICTKEIIAEEAAKIQAQEEGKEGES